MQAYERHTVCDPDCVTQSVVFLHTISSLSKTPKIFKFSLFIWLFLWKEGGDGRRRHFSGLQTAWQSFSWVSLSIGNFPTKNAKIPKFGIHRRTHRNCEFPTVSQVSKGTQLMCLYQIFFGSKLPKHRQTNETQTEHNVNLIYPILSYPTNNSQWFATRKSWKGDKPELMQTDSPNKFTERIHWTNPTNSHTRFSGRL